MDERYEHDAECDRKSFTEVDARGNKTCLDCAGIFDAATGIGRPIMSPEFDTRAPAPEEDV